MREITFEDRHRIHAESMLFVREICEKHNLTYFLAYGTLLGAVRHKGFIPWDDDVDFLMPAEDYEKLVAISKEVETEDWEILSYKKDHDYLHPYMKVCNKHTKVFPSRFINGKIYGVSTDIFPLYYVHAEDDDQMRAVAQSFYEECRRILRIVKPNAAVQPGLKTKMRNLIMGTYYHLIGKHRLSLTDGFLDMERRALALGSEGSNYALNIYQRKKPVVFWEKVFFQPSDGEKLPSLEFEGQRYSVPADYDAVLSKKYGHYMVPPEESKRVPPHYVKAYYTDR